jgi:hypothetical protein
MGHISKTRRPFPALFRLASHSGVNSATHSTFLFGPAKRPLRIAEFRRWLASAQFLHRDLEGAMRFIVSALLLVIVIVASATLEPTGVLAQCAVAVGCPAPGPIPGAGLLSYIAIGAVGAGTAAWKQLRKK